MSNPHGPSANGGSKFNASEKGAPKMHAFREHRAHGKHSDADSAMPPFTPQFVIEALLRRWKLAVPASLLLAAAAVAVVLLTFHPTYEATAWLNIAESTPYIAFESREKSRKFLETQMELICSPLILGPVVSRPEIAQVPEIKRQDAPIVWLATQIKAAAVGQSELVKISFEAHDPTAAAAVVNGVVGSYLDFRGKNDSEQVQRVIELLEEEKGRRMREVDAMRDTIRELAKQAAGKDPFSGKAQRDATASHPLADLQVRLVNAEVERQILEARVQAFEEALNKEQINISDSQVNEVIEKQPLILAFHKALAEKQARLAEYARTLARGEKDPKCVQLQEEIKRDEASLEKARTEMRTEAREKLTAEVKSSRQNELAKMHSALETARLMERLLRKREEGLVANTKEATGDTLQVEFKQAELTRAEEVLSRIAERAVKLRTEQRAPARVELLAKATPPTIPVEAVPYKRLVGAGMGAFCVPLLLVVGWEWLSRRVRNSEQLELYTQLPVLGEIARLPVRASRVGANGRTEREFGLFEESIDSLRTCMVLSEPLSNSQVLAITSASKSEGKTSVALQLAVSIARASGQRVLLIDADMRSPDIHRLLQMKRGPGLAEVLAKKCSLPDAIVTDWSQFVHVMPAGKLTTSPHRLVGNGAMKALLDQLRPKYRYIVVDTPPILPASEALVLARTADACLFCTMRDVSRIDRIRRCSERLVAAGARPVGAVLSGVSTSEYTNYYGTYYGNVGGEEDDD